MKRGVAFQRRRDVFRFFHYVFKGGLNRRSFLLSDSGVHLSKCSCAADSPHPLQADEVQRRQTLVAVTTICLREGEFLVLSNDNETFSS